MTCVSCATATSDGAPDAGGRGLPGDEGGGAIDKPDSGLEVIADASPPHNDPPDAAPPSCQTQTLNLLGNPNLDSGQGGGWLESSSGDYPLIVNQDTIDGDIDAHTPVFVAWLGGYPDAVDSMSQEIAIPADATAVHVTGHRYFITSEGGGVYDRSWVDITSTSGMVLETLKQFSNQDANGAWTAFDFPVTGGYQGQTIRFRLRSDADATLRSSFFYDSLAFEVTSCQ
ncbi:MAG TPA: hypothetical protein VFU21_09475 [Kofleriaceae bacterium]|nr:hypothetical protein [Kofleriaceae bacterium]